jgi:hypothetical protein
MDRVREMGVIHCPCGWSGDASEARIRGTRSPLELDCPECGMHLYGIVMEE